ncbi:MAG: NUDIX hydrolase [Saprospiraceae bacterium]
MIINYMNNNKSNWERVQFEDGPDLKLFRARFDYMRNPRNGKTERMIVLVSPDSVNVVPITTNGDILFVRQYRFGIGEYTLELPGGIVDPGEDHSPAAQRELEEETGHTGGEWRYLGKIPSNPVFMDSYIHHWVAKGVEKTHELSLDDGEAIDLVQMPIETVKSQLSKGYFQHPHTVNALLLYFGL